MPRLLRLRLRRLLARSPSKARVALASLLANMTEPLGTAQRSCATVARRPNQARVATASLLAGMTEPLRTALRSSATLSKANVATATVFLEQSI